jgi:isoleucyl-tRNA synthetase
MSALLEDAVVAKKYYPEAVGKPLPQLEEEVLQHWHEQAILQKIKERMKGGDPFVFCDGPPTANARPHVGHALTRVVKDAFLRYNVMNGRKIVPYIAGWDCHGLPVEIEVERALGLKTKRDIDALGIGRFNELCRESVVKYECDWEQMSRRVGYWIDYDNAYYTMSRDYIESVWWSLKQLHSKGLLSKGHKVVPYCSRCGTTLSAHEVALGFRESEDRFVVVEFKVKGMGASVLGYTALPWTLIGNALLAVDEDKAYVTFEHGGRKLIVAEERKGLFAPSDPVIERITGKDLVGREYEPLFRYELADEKAYRIVHSSEAMRQEEGTGIMCVSPAHGSTDYEIGTAAGTEGFDLVDMDGRFNVSVKELAGRVAKDSDSEVIRLLESKGLLFKWGIVRHSYPYCWRCETPLIYKLLDSWFVRTSKAKERMVFLNEQVRWVPETFKHGRFGNFLADIKDWAISRSRYWGTPLPIWTCGNGHEVCVGSYHELQDLSGRPLPEDFDPHRPAIDSVDLRCPYCGSSMRREEYVLDCWYDSGCAPFAQYHYPFENMEEFDTHQSVDFIAEGVDQTRGWFYTQLAIGTLLFDRPAFTSVLVLGHVLDEKGRKMTRGKENVIYPDEVFGSVGADASRLFFLGTPASQLIPFSRESVRQTMLGTLTTLLNVYSFFASNANAYGFRPQKEYSRTHDLDRWVASRLNSTIVECRSGFDGLEAHVSVRAVRSFVEDLSNWYVRRSRRRFWEDSDPQDRFSAHCTLYECLLTLSKLMAPMTPFFGDWLYRTLRGPRESVHLESYPVADESSINRPLEDQMEVVMRVVEAGRLARQKVNVKLRQPLPSVVVAVDSTTAWTLRRHERMLADELNVKRIEVVESRESMIHFAASPNLKSLGPKLKESASEVTKLLAKIDQNDLVRHLRSMGKIRIGGFDLTEEDVVVTEREKPGYSHASVGNIHVYMQLEVPQNLKLEGLAREIIRRIQNMRKEQGLEFEDRIEVDYSGHSDLEEAVVSHKAHIMREVHASSMQRKEHQESPKKWVINKKPMELSVRRSSR